MSPAEIKQLTEELTKQAKIQQEIGQSIEAYMSGMDEYKRTLKEINKNKQREIELQRLTTVGTQKEKDLASIKLKILQDQTDELEKQSRIMGGALSSVNKKSLLGAKLMGEAAKGLGKAFVNLPGMIQSAYGKIKGSGLFEMEKEIKKSALSMGVLSKQSDSFRTTIVNAAKETAMIGIGVKELSQMQSAYSEELGRAVTLSKEGLVAMGQMAVVTGLGAEGAAKMSAEMENQGLSAERTAAYVEQTLNDASAMGINATKIMKNIANNTKMLNRYNFKDGVKGLTKMASLVTKLGVNMEFAAGFAEKLFNIEGAVDMSAQLQVMGGEWSKLADPFRLMFMARNDMAGLTEEIANAAASSATFNTKTKEFELGSLEMSRLRVIAEQTGISYDELATAGKNAAKFTKIKGQVSFTMNEDEKEFLANTAKLDENGNARIEVEIGGTPKLLSQLTSADREAIKSRITEQATMKKRAEQSITFDEQITYLINELKVFMLPLVKTMNEKLIPKLRDLSDKFTVKGGWGEKIEKLAESVGGVISAIGGFIIDNPIMSAMIYGAAKFGGMFFDVAKWLLNGIALAKGFNMAASIGGGDSDPTDGVESVLDKFGKKIFNQKITGAAAKTSKGMAGNFKGGLKSFGGVGAGILAGGLAAWDEWSENAEKGMDKGENTGRTTAKAAGAGLGAWGGAAAGAAIGSAFPVVGTIIGGLIGAALGGFAGGSLGEAGGDAIYGDEDRMTRPLHDGIIGGMSSSPLSGMLGSIASSSGNMLGSDFSKGRGVIQGGKITPIDNKDDLLAMKPSGAIDKTSKSQGSNIVTHSFGNININGEILLKSPGNNPGEVVDLLKDASFKRDITRIIQVELEKNRNGGKNKG